MVCPTTAEFIERIKYPSPWGLPGLLLADLPVSEFRAKLIVTFVPHSVASSIDDPPPPNTGNIFHIVDLREMLVLGKRS